MFLHERNDIIETSDIIFGTDELGRDTFNEYTIIRELGSGASARVCLCTKPGKNGILEKYV